MGPAPSARPIVTVPVTARLVVKSAKEMATDPVESFTAIEPRTVLALKTASCAVTRAPKLMTPADCKVTAPVAPAVITADVVSDPAPLASASANSRTLAAPELLERSILLLTIILFAALRVREVLALPAVTTASVTVIFPA